MKLTKRSAVAGAVVAAAATACAIAAGPAAADSADPTVGDTVRYVFFSDTQVNESLAWYDAYDDMQTMSRPSLPTRSKDRKTWSGSITVTSRSTYQFTGSSFQTSGHYAACRTYVNGVLVSEDSSTGRYAMAVC
ncbi:MULTISPECIES: hypothetical protein [Gordonia]|uniref:Uncharacterized protein n=1 Tax=Gordonia cholesterolivorans TaxID=559625 RepID=A0ABN3HCN3_9ACTN|nr:MULTISPECIES: hypothetical protein [Gordonia]KJR07042.1 hypothetical protein UG54_11940 [Gordonia sihwensis]KXT55990.1 hypothetical protein Y710_16090 [Gordonia sp. QH-12]MBY4571102.1 hypothetical protein [Gordonia sihwensis]